MRRDEQKHGHLQQAPRSSSCQSRTKSTESRKRWLCLSLSRRRTAAKKGAATQATARCSLSCAGASASSRCAEQIACPRRLCGGVCAPEKAAAGRAALLLTSKHVGSGRLCLWCGSCGRSAEQASCWFRCCRASSVPEETAGISCAGSSCGCGCVAAAVGEMLRLAFFFSCLRPSDPSLRATNNED